MHPHDQWCRRSPSNSCIISCRFFLPIMHFYAATSALKMPVKFLTKGALYVFYLLCCSDCWILENVGVWRVRPLAPDTRLSWTLIIIIIILTIWFTKQWWMTIWRANNVFKQVKMYRLSSTSCIYWLRCSTPSSSGSLVKQSLFEEADHI